MKGHLTIIMLAAMLAASCSTARYPQVFAHRGCTFPGYIPENSLDGVMMAARFGYPTTECDVKFTLDSVLVLMHDDSINRTMRNAAGYSKVKGRLNVKDCDFQTLRSGYVLASSDESMRRPIPTLEEYLLQCKESGIVPILHCKIYEGYELAARILGDRWIAFTGDLELLKRVRALAPDVLILLSIGGDDLSSTPEEIAARLDSIGGRCGISSMVHDNLRAEMCSTLSAKGYETQSSIFRTPHEMKAIHDGASIILSDFTWFQTEGRRPAGRFRKKGVRLDEGMSLATGWPEDEFSAMVLSVRCKGEFDLTVNGTRLYRISHKETDTETLGFRMHAEAASVELKSAADGSTVQDFKVDYYRL